MRKIFTGFCLVAGMTLFSFSQSVNANPLSAVVEKIIDGDTIILNQGGTPKTIQLACIDSPDWIKGKPQPNAQASKNRLTELVPVGASVQYYDLGSIAKGNRILGVIFNNKININLQMVKEGQSKLHRSYSQTCANSANALAEAENNAKNQRLGIWQ